MNGYYKLGSPYALRGWKDVPRALLNVSDGRAAILDEFRFSVLSLCDGKFPAALLLDPHIKVLKKFEKKGIVSFCDKPSGIMPFQSYKSYPCNRVSSAHWSITGKCNLKCRHCYLSAPEGKFGELDTGACLKIADDLALAGISSVSLTGGEPFVRKDFWDITDRLVKNGTLISQVYTNGVLVNGGLLEEFEKRRLKPEFCLSYDGAGYHDWMRGVEGAEAKALKAIKLLVNNGFKVSVEVSLNKKNVASLTRSVFLLADMGVSHIKATPTADSGEWLKENSPYTLSAEEVYDEYLKFIAEYRRAGSPVGVMLGGFFLSSAGSEEYVSPLVKNYGENDLSRPLCASARENLYITADGKVLPCIPLSGLPIEKDMPSLLETPLTEILSDSPYFDMVSAGIGDLFSKNEECGACSERFKCGGGCRAAAIAGGKGYFGKDEYSCRFFKGGYGEKIKRIYAAAL